LTSSGFKPKPLITEYFKVVNSLRNCDKNADETWDTHLHGGGWCLFCLGMVFGQQIVLQGQYISVSKFTRWSTFEIQPQYFVDILCLKDCDWSFEIKNI